ncbi:NAD(P)-dependent alcohol dehydrogenase [Arthrobacter sp. 35W]|uniref:NAD(P)-dependent alcohol dehydrogenase n=1 Tax=Arthrobacter sp. 35W TaxID=1132441 RepID=UPI000401E393|nr:NAD(P)-dependent alcohol dehydrogenase [Arthrobacter sp. 35W]
MKAIIQDSYGESMVLRLDDVEKPAVGADDVLVRVRAAGVDAGVWHLMAGKPYLVRLLGFGLRRPKVRVRGLDLAGTVAAVGANVTQFREGDDVFGTSLNGTFAEYAITTAGKLAPKPAGLSFEQAAAVPVSGCAALHGLRDVGGLKSGHKVLVLGAGGGVGSFAVQIAKAMGAEVTGVASTAKVELVRTLGADHVIDRTTDDFAADGRIYDVILDTAGNNPLSRLRRILAPQGTLAIVGGEGGGRWLGGFQRQLGSGLASLATGQRLRALMSSESTQDLADLRELIDAGKLTPAVDKTYPLAAAAEAIDDVHAGRTLGKAVITI